MSPHHLVDHLFRNRAGQLVAWLTRIFGPAHLDLAEEVVQDALLKALQQWPYSGVPHNPGGWLFRVARNGALDVLRRNATFASRAHEIAAELHQAAAMEPSDSAIEDDELRMVFMCCHPSLPPDARVALSLKTAGGFSVAEIARAFLSSEATIAQRLVRAKRTLRDQRVGLDLPRGSDLGARTGSVLEVIYLLFNEGYKAHAGEDLIRQDLCGEALRLGRLVAQSAHVVAAGVLGGAPTAHALVALMAFQAARLPARVDGNGEMVLLEDQDRSLWDRGLVALGFAHLERSAEGPEMTAYHIQAALAAVHAGAERAELTRWDRILSLYDDLMAVNPSPVIRLNRAVALSRVAGPAAALAALQPLEDEPALANYYLLPSVAGRLFAELGDRDAATACYRRALERPCSEPERRFLQRRLVALASWPPFRGGKDYHVPVETPMSEAPKSAFELAMEKLKKKDVEAGVEEQVLTEAQRTAIAEAKNIYEARVAERRIMHQSAVLAVFDPAELAERDTELRRDLEHFASDRDAKIKKIRSAQ